MLRVTTMGLRQHRSSISFRRSFCDQAPKSSQSEGAKKRSRSDSAPMNIPQPEDPTLKMLFGAAAAAAGLFIGTRVLVYGARGIAAFGGPVGVVALGAGGTMFLIHQGKFHYAAAVALVPFAAMVWYVTSRDNEQARQRQAEATEQEDARRKKESLERERMYGVNKYNTSGSHVVQPSSPNLGSSPQGGRNNGPAMG